MYTNGKRKYKNSKENCTVCAMGVVFPLDWSGKKRRRQSRRDYTTYIYIWIYIYIIYTCIDMALVGGEEGEKEEEEEDEDEYKKKRWRRTEEPCARLYVYILYI
jgi:hypothetical protein